MAVKRGEAALRFALTVALRDAAEDLGAQMPELVQTARLGDAIERLDGAIAADVEERLGEVEPRRSDRVAARAERRRLGGAPAARHQPVAEPRRPAPLGDA